MKICAIIPTSRTREAIVGDAVSSALGFVDGLTVIQIPEGEDNTLDVILTSAKGKPVEFSPLAEGSMADYRNAGLIRSTLIGYDWALMLDTDQRMKPNGVDIRAALAGIPESIDVLEVQNADGKDQSAKFFRLPASARYRENRHEELVGERGKCILRKVRYVELEKTPEQLEARLQDDLVGLQEQMRKDPDNPRWLYFYAVTQMAKAQPDYLSAAHHLSIAIDLCNSDLTPWFLYKRAECHALLRANDTAMMDITEGITRAPWMAEFYFLAARICAVAGDLANAVCWAHGAIAQGAGGLDHLRYGYRDQRAIYEGPWELLEKIHRAMGDIPAAEIAGQRAKELAHLRIDLNENGER
jgi:hypothetical protein